MTFKYRWLGVSLAGLGALCTGCSAPECNNGKVEALRKQVAEMEARVVELEKVRASVEKLESGQKALNQLADQHNDKIKELSTRLLVQSSSTPKGNLTETNADSHPTTPKAAKTKQSWKLPGKWVTNKGEISLRATQVEVMYDWEQEMGLYLRGQEGTEFYSCDSYKNPDNSSCKLTPHLSGGFPTNADTPTKGVAGGRLAFLVQDWFVPVTLFVKAGGWTAGPELAVLLQPE